MLKTLKKRWVYVWYLTIKNISINRKIIVDSSEIIRHKNGEFPIYIEGVKVKNNRNFGRMNVVRKWKRKY